jgi:hypothetical protein
MEKREKVYAKARKDTSAVRLHDSCTASWMREVAKEKRRCATSLTHARTNF